MATDRRDWWLNMDEKRNPGDCEHCGATREKCVRLMEEDLGPCCVQCLGAR